jgi:invasion protein IalB
MHVRFFSASLLAVIGFAATGPSAAQQRTTATYEDWELQCETASDPAPPHKLCGMAQVTQVQGKNIPFSRVVIENPAKGRPVKLMVQVPANVSLRSNVGVRTNDADPGLSIPFDRCLPTGCFAEFELKDDSVKKFYAGTGAGKVTFKDAGGRDVAVPLSFKGFRSAFDALSKE